MSAVCRLAARFGRFNLVGLMGAVLQLVLMDLLMECFGLPEVAAAPIAVEIVILHNFFWHERWTWIERTKVLPWGFSSRIVRFHFANGLISLAGNAALMWLLVAGLRIPYLIANLMAIAACSVINFWAGDRFVFRASG